MAFSDSQLMLYHHSSMCRSAPITFKIHLRICICLTATLAFQGPLRSNTRWTYFAEPVFGNKDPCDQIKVEVASCYLYITDHHSCFFSLNGLENIRKNIHSVLKVFNIFKKLCCRSWIKCHIFFFSTTNKNYGILHPVIPDATYTMILFCVY